MATKSDTEKQWYMATVSETLAAFDVQVRSGHATERVRELSKAAKKRASQTKPKTPALPPLFWAILLIMLVLSASVFELESSSAPIVFTLSACLLGAFAFAQQGFVRHILLVVAKTPPAQVSVRRDGKIAKISANTIVLGDIFILSAGDYVPATLRLLETKDLYVDEADVTGQVAPAVKSTFALRKKTKLENQKNMIAPGSFIYSGKGTGVVVELPEKNSKHQELGSTKLNKKQQRRQYVALVSVFVLGLSVIFWSVSPFAAIALSALLSLSVYYYSNFWLQYVTWASLYDQAASNGLMFRDFKRLKKFVDIDTVFVQLPKDYTDMAAFVHQMQAELRLEVRPLIAQSDVKKFEKELNIQDSALTYREFMSANRAKKIKQLNEYQLLVGFDDVAVTEAISLLQQTGHKVAWIDDASAPVSASKVASSFVSHNSEPTEFLQERSDIAYSRQPSVKRLAAFFDTKTRFKNMTAY